MRPAERLKARAAAALRRADEALAEGPAWERHPPPPAEHAGAPANAIDRGHELAMFSAVGAAAAARSRSPSPPPVAPSAAIAPEVRAAAQAGGWRERAAAARAQREGAQ